MKIEMFEACTHLGQDEFAESYLCYREVLAQASFSIKVYSEISPITIICPG